MSIVPEHGSEPRDALGSEPSEAAPAPLLQPIAGRIEPGEDIYVEGPPMVLEVERTQETTRRVIAGLVIAAYSILMALGLAAVAFAKSDAQAIALILTPYGTLVTAVVAYYFLKARR